MTRLSEASRIVQAIPTNGDVIHAKKIAEPVSWMYPEQRRDYPGSRLGRLLWGSALCGVRGRDAGGFGGLAAVLTEGHDLVDFDTENIPEPKSGWNGDAINIVCPRCVARVRRLRQNGGA